MNEVVQWKCPSLLYKASLGDGSVSHIQLNTELLLIA